MYSLKLTAPVTGIGLGFSYATGNFIPFVLVLVALVLAFLAVTALRRKQAIRQSR